MTILTSRSLVLMVALSAVAGCRCPHHVDPVPDAQYGFEIADADPIVAQLEEVAGRLAMETSPAVIVQACAATFTTRIAGMHCDERIERCCHGGCNAADAKAACDPRRRTELGAICCAEAGPGFFRHVAPCAGMALNDCVISPKAVP